MRKSEGSGGDNEKNYRKTRSEKHFSTTPVAYAPNSDREGKERGSLNCSCGVLPSKDFEIGNSFQEEVNCITALRR